VIVNLCRPDSIITVGEINEFLDNLAKTDDYSEKVKLVIPVIRKCNGEDLKWLSRIILKELKIGLHHEKVLACYHPEALDFYNMTSNLNEACKEFLDPKHTLTNVLRVRQLF
jgi:DNA ligase-4